MNLHPLRLVTVSLVALVPVLTPLHALAQEARDVFADTWAATDALGRSLPSATETGPPRDDRFVGIFYFLWQGGHGTAGPFDITRILAENPHDPQWGPQGAFHFWGEPLFGYYLATDEYVIRKHAQMLADAGVDTLFFDATNGFPYVEEFLTVCRVYSQLRTQGWTTPSIAFLARDTAVPPIFESLYAPGRFRELWFHWQGKPLLLTCVEPEKLGQQYHEFFTIKHSWAWSAAPWFGDGKDRWAWLDHHPQKWGWTDDPDTPEAMPVTVAQHATTNIGRSFHNGQEPEPAEQRPELGLCFQEQWERALDVDPSVVFVTGWNEWVAQRFLSDGGGRVGPHLLSKGDTFFVDAYTQEYSRDIEPMKGGHTDSYYYQMISYIRQFKGCRPVPEAPVSVSGVAVDGAFRDWVGVTPEYRDQVGDPARRNHPGWGEAGPYHNHTGRNDIVEAKVAADPESVFFYAAAATPLSPVTDSNWMLLYIDTDADAATGWHGYDRLVNLERPEAGLTSVHAWDPEVGDWIALETVPFAVRSSRLELRIPRRLLDTEPDRQLEFHFKWADNPQSLDDILEFTVNGDAAPNDRFSYVYRQAP